MPLIAVKCPSCGGDLELDNEKEFGFCMFCGTKVLIQQTQKINVTGHVTIDNSKNIEQYYLLASNAFQSKRYGDAYRYYAQLLECGEETPEILFNRGICAGYISAATEFNTSEFIAGLSAIKEVLQAESYNDDKDNEMEVNGKSYLTVAVDNETETRSKQYLTLAVESLMSYRDKCSKHASDTDKFGAIRSSLYEVACAFATEVSNFPHPKGKPYLYHIYFAVSELFDYAATFGGKSCSAQQEQIITNHYQTALHSCTAIATEFAQYAQSLANIPVAKGKIESHILNRSIFVLLLVLASFIYISIVIEAFSIVAVIVFTICAILIASAVYRLPAGEKWTSMIANAETHKNEMFDQLINRIKSLK